MTTKQHIQRAILGILLTPFVLTGVLTAWIWISLQAGYAYGEKALTKIVTGKEES